MGKEDDITKAIAYVRRNVDMDDVDYVINKVWKRHSSLSCESKDLEMKIHDLMEEYGSDHDLPEGWWLDEIEEEEILLRL